MVQEEGIVVRGPGAEEIELPGHVAGVEGEVLAYQVGEAWDDVFFAEKLLLDRG